MPAGRPRKPLEQKRATARSSTKDSAGRPLPAEGTLISLPGCGDQLPPYPSTLVENGPGRARWDRIWSEAGAWISPKVDAAIVTRLCELEDLRSAYKTEILNTGFTVEGSMGQIRLHPMVGEIRALDDQLTRYETQLGLTPSSRASLSVAEVQKTIDGVGGQVAAIMQAQAGVNGKRGG